MCRVVELCVDLSFAAESSLILGLTLATVNTFPGVEARGDSRATSLNATIGRMDVVTIGSLEPCASSVTLFDAGRRHDRSGEGGDRARIFLIKSALGSFDTFGSLSWLLAQVHEQDSPSWLSPSAEAA